jgi:hypothetical protein
MPAKRSKAERKAAIIAGVEAYLEEWLVEDGDEIRQLSELEEIALNGGRLLEEALIKAQVAEAQTGQAVPGPTCPDCGGELHYKGRKRKRLVTQAGEVEMDRAYYYCESCRQGVFPPG